MKPSQISKIPPKNSQVSSQSHNYSKLSKLPRKFSSNGPNKLIPYFLGLVLLALLLIKFRTPSRRELAAKHEKPHAIEAVGGGERNGGGPNGRKMTPGDDGKIVPGSRGRIPVINRRICPPSRPHAVGLTCLK
jgi:hypothetical protein